MYAVTREVIVEGVFRVSMDWCSSVGVELDGRFALIVCWGRIGGGVVTVGIGWSVGKTE